MMIPKPSIIQEQFLPINDFSRIGKVRPETKVIDIHWVGNHHHDHANEVARYFEVLKNQTKLDEIKDTYASSNFIIGVRGKILEVVPVDEVSYTAGGSTYTNLAQTILGPLYTSNRYMGTPNWCSVSIELCHPDETGRFTKETLNSLVILAHWLCKKYNLNPLTDIVRHYDITGKICPRWFVENENMFYYTRNRIASLEDLCG